MQVDRLDFVLWQGQVCSVRSAGNVTVDLRPLGNSGGRVFGVPVEDLRPVPEPHATTLRTQLERERIASYRGRNSPAVSEFRFRQAPGG